MSEWNNNGTNQDEMIAIVDKTETEESYCVHNWSYSEADSESFRIHEMPGGKVHDWINKERYLNG